MTKKPPWATEGRSWEKQQMDFFDHAYWLATDPELCDWVAAFRSAEIQHDPAELFELLRPLVPESVAPHLKDFLDRQLVKRRGPRRTPSYDRTETDSDFEVAIIEVKELVAAGTPVEEAIPEAANHLNLNSNTLADRYHGRHGGARKKRKRDRER